MLPTNNLFDLNNLDLLTADEKKFNQTYVRKLQSYADGKVEGIQIRNLISGSVTITKRQQCRGFIAMLKWNMSLKSMSEGKQIANAKKEVK